MARGWIVPIGGAEEKTGDPRILRRFARLCGGGSARLLVIPTASRMEDTGSSYADLFQEMGVAGVRVLHFESRADGERPEMLQALEEADGVFLTGGNQLRLTTHLGGTPFAKALRRANGAGLHVAGTSAGAAYLSAHMIAFGAEGPTPMGEKVTLTPGLGLIHSVIVDQHFRQRDRLGRLLAALAYNPFAVGIGLDEDTAAFIGHDYTVEVMGSGGMTVVDPSELKFSSMDAARAGEPVCMIGVKVHILVEGATYNIKSKVAEPSRVGVEQLGSTG